jgi:hypothetical protein
MSGCSRRRGRIGGSLCSCHRRCDRLTCCHRCSACSSSCKCSGSGRCLRRGSCCKCRSGARPCPGPGLPGSLCSALGSRDGRSVRGSSGSGSCAAGRAGLGGRLRWSSCRCSNRSQRRSHGRRHSLRRTKGIGGRCSRRAGLRGRLCRRAAPRSGARAGWCQSRTRRQGQGGRAGACQSDRGT